MGVIVSLIWNLQSGICNPSWRKNAPTWYDGKMLNRDVVGRPYGPQTFEVDRSKIRELAMALGDGNPLYYSEEESAKTAWGGMIAPPTFATLLNFWVPQDSLYADMGVDYRYLLHGEQEYEYEQPIRPGMVLTVSRVCTKIYTKPGKSGVMEFAVIESDIRDTRDNARVVLSRSTIVLRWPAEASHA
jgi:hypothetical protein